MTEQRKCLNCSTPLTGKYCSECGQRDLPPRQGVSDLFVNFVSSFFSFESKFFNTFKYLLFYPGRIVNDYNAGKRESYYHPARMYVFLSFIFFLLFSMVFSIDNDVVDIDENEIEQNRNVQQQKVDSLRNRYSSPFQIGTDSTEAETVHRYDSLQNTLPKSERDGILKRYFKRKGIGIQEKSKKDIKEVGRRFVDGFLENIPKMIFVLMPLFALTLKLLYARRDFYYSEHLVFTVFYYDFVYLTASLATLVSQIEWLNWVSYILYLWMFLYLYKAIRNVYKQRRSKTIFKFILLLGIFFFFVVVGIVGIALIAFTKI